MRKVGITTTIPVEILYAADIVPVDLNNIFVIDENYDQYIEKAERDGFPRSMCTWIKGLYGVCMDHGIDELIGVHEGDCSNSKTLLDVWELKGKTIYPFSYPQTRDKKDLEKFLNLLMEQFHVDSAQVENKRNELNEIRKLAWEIDKLTVDGKVSGFENHLFNVCCSDFNGNPKEFEKELKSQIEVMKKRKPVNPKVRLGYLGVPPMTVDLYDFVERFDSKIIYNEVQREFSFPRALKAENMADQYYDYTYPYSNSFRITEIKKEIKERKLDGIIHYTQAFCHRAIDNIILKEELDIPILNIEGDRLQTLDARTKLRIEAFLDMLVDIKEFKE